MSYSALKKALSSRAYDRLFEDSSDFRPNDFLIDGLRCRVLDFVGI